MTSTGDLVTIIDLITIIDFCDQMATLIRDDWTDPRTECRAIWDAHDMAHVLTGGDRKRDDWSSARAMLQSPDDDGRFGEAWPDVRRRMDDLIARL